MGGTPGRPWGGVYVLCPWDFPGKSTGVGCHFLPQGIFLTQGSNLRLLHWQADSLPLSHQGSPHRFDPWSGRIPHALEQPAEALLPVRLFMGPGQLGRGLGPGLGWPAEALLPVRLFMGPGQLGRGLGLKLIKPVNPKGNQS